jgi:hypothetical protein
MTLVHCLMNDLSRRWRKARQARTDGGDAMGRDGLVDTDMDRFQVVIPMRGAVPNFARHSAVAIGTKIWVFGGYDGIGSFFGLAVFDTGTHTCGAAYQLSPPAVTKLLALTTRVLLCYPTRHRGAYLDLPRGPRRGAALALQPHSRCSRQQNV